MAKYYSKATVVILSVAALLLSLVFVDHVAESRVLPHRGSISKHGNGKGGTFLMCMESYGAVAGDTCFDIAKSFNLTTDYFTSINPNLNCDNIFIGEWLCVDAITL